MRVALRRTVKENKIPSIKISGLQLFPTSMALLITK